MINHQIRGILGKRPFRAKQLLKQILHNVKGSRTSFYRFLKLIVKLELIRRDLIYTTFNTKTDTNSSKIWTEWLKRRFTKSWLFSYIKINSLLFTKNQRWRDYVNVNILKWKQKTRRRVKHYCLIETFHCIVVLPQYKIWRLFSSFLYNLFFLLFLHLHALTSMPLVFSFYFFIPLFELFSYLSSLVIFCKFQQAISSI